MRLTRCFNRYHAELAVLAAPFAVGVMVLVAWPLAQSLWLAFTQVDRVLPFPLGAWPNFTLLSIDPLVAIAVDNSLAFLRLAVPARLMLALALGLWFNTRQPGVNGYRTLVYLPTVLPDPAYALLWLWLVNPVYGPLNAVLAGLGVQPLAWLADPALAPLVFVLMTSLQIGEGLVVVLAGLKTIPPVLYDVARLDGASAWRQFTAITLPWLAPWLVLLSARDVALTLHSTFVANYLMTGGDPYYATLFLPLLVYEMLFDNGWLGLGSAAGGLFLALTGLLVGLVVWGVQAAQEVNDAT